MTIEVANIILNAKDDMSGIEIALVAIIRGLQKRVEGDCGAIRRAEWPGGSAARRGKGERSGIEERRRERASSIRS
jgi:hypothetical protein